jgi:hypothetical protein
VDGKQFDDLIKELGTARLSRAIALRGFLTGVVAAVTGIGLIADSEDADAKKRGKGRQGSHKNDKKRDKGGQEAHADGKKRDRKKKGGQKNKGGKKKKKGQNNRSRNVQQQDVACSEPSSVTKDSGNPPLCPGGIRVNSPERTCKIITDPCGCKLEWCVTLGADGEELSFGPVDGQPACTVTRVVVKGGNEGANIYTFDPPALCADGLTTPTDQEISHFDLCGIACCVPETCEDLGVCGENLDNGCNGTIDCPCPTDCPGGGANNTCDNGTCVCDPDTCADLGVCGEDLDDGCCGTIDCPCPTDCPGGGSNNTCVEGTCVCDPDTCASEGLECTSSPVDDGCCGTFRCPCPTECPGGGENNTCDNGTCVCEPNTCADLGVCGTGLADGCCGTIDCECPTTCPGGGANNTCDNGECICEPDTCASEGLQCTSTPLDDGCCGEFRCPCPRECPGGGANNTCDNGICVCDPDTCADLPPGVECGTGFDDGCCGAFNCNCPTNCPAGTDDGPNNTCEGGTCVCTKNTCESLGVTCGVHDDGCCGEIDCGPCPEGCTPGYWKNHPGAWVGFSPNALVSSVFNTGSCGSLGSKTLLQALSLKGGSSFCGGVEILLRAAVAALLNAANPGVNYTLTTAQIIAQVNAAIASGVRANVIALAADLDARNNAIGGCPCNNNGCPAS